MPEPRSAGARPATAEPPIVVIGVMGCDLEPATRILDTLAPVNVLVASQRRLTASDAAGLAPGAERVLLSGNLEHVMDRIAGATGTVCVLATGDPGFFGITRALASRFGPSRLGVHPAPSSVSLAFARLGLAWDDARVVSAHGRPLTRALDEVRHAGKVAILCSPEAPPEAIGSALLADGAAFHTAAVCSDLACPEELVAKVSLEELAGRSWSPMSVVVLISDAGIGSKSISWSPGRSPGGEEPGVAKPGSRLLALGMPESSYAHRRGVITKAELRAVVLSKLALPPRGVMWDVGAGSGSVGIECSAACPELEVIAVEERPDDAARIEHNARSKGSRVLTVNGRAPAALASLPDPDRVFVGGGGMEVIAAAMTRLKPGGRIVATFAAIDRAASAANVLGSLAQIGVARGRQLPGGAWRLAAENPVFVVWGPELPPVEL